MFLINVQVGVDIILVVSIAVLPQLLFFFLNCLLLIALLNWLLLIALLIAVLIIAVLTSLLSSLIVDLNDDDTFNTSIYGYVSNELRSFIEPRRENTGEDIMR